MLLCLESLVLLQSFQPKFRILLSPSYLRAVCSVLDFMTLIIFEEDVDDVKDVV